MDKKDPTQPPDGEMVTTGIRSLRELIEAATGKTSDETQPKEDFGLADALPFPFLALVGQYEMKLALLLTLINPAIGGALLIGPRGSGKTTAVRGLLELMPPIERSACFYGCLPEDIEAGGMDAVCPDCAKKYAMGESLTRPDRVKIVELPLNSSLEDVIGGIDLHFQENPRQRLKRGILARADLNLLFVDEVNLLADNITDAILDASATGRYTLQQGTIQSTYKARFSLVGSMNPEEGQLRPQIMDRFGLRVIIESLADPAQRLEAYRRSRAYLDNPQKFVNEYNQATQIALDELTAARELLPKVQISDEVAGWGIKLVRDLKIDSIRAEITLFEAARAHAAADTRIETTIEDLKQIAPMALRLRRSEFMPKFIESQVIEDENIRSLYS